MAGDPSEAVREAFASLSRMVLRVESSREATMTQIAAVACGLIEGCDLVSLTLVERQRPETAGATHPEALDLDHAQYGAGSGPCLTAINEERTIRVPSLPDTARQWGEPLAAAAVRLGVHSSLSTPLVVDGSCFGGLNLYGRPANAFSRVDEEVVQSFAREAAVVAANARNYWTMVDTTRQLESALESRAVIEQAKGILMARQGCSSDEAFDILRRASQRSNRKLRQIAQDLVEGKLSTEGGS
jgi:GAF domain-containing protein